MEDESSNKTKIVKIATIIRVRPLLQFEVNAQQSIICKDQKTLEINTFGSKRLEKVQALFGPECTQRQVFIFIEPFLSKVMDGYNVTIFTYGQTGSGKTYTMFGSDWNNILKPKLESNNKISAFSNKQQQLTFVRDIEQDENHSGLIPRCINLVFDKLIVKRRKHIKVYCSFIQLYNENMLDLLQDDDKVAKEQKLVIHENKQDGIYVEGLTEEQVETVEDCLEYMKKGEKNRVVRHTHMNIKSSRSHTVFQLLIEEVFPAKKTYRRIKINLCDLAGSEKIIKTDKIQNQHFEELKNINLSLTTLGKVISTLSAKENHKPAYRQSKLTRLLQDSLGGNTYTAIIATLTTKSSCLDESLNTLKFLERASQIKTEIVSKTFSDNPEMRNLEREINYLKDVLKFKRNGANHVDLDINEKLKKLQVENEKLKEMVDKDLIEKLQKENHTLKRQLQKKNVDQLSDSYFQSKNSLNYNTIDHDNRQKDRDSTAEIHSDNGGKTSSFLKMPPKRYGNKNNYSGKTEDGSSTNKETLYERGTGISIFPSISKNRNGVSGNKILERILEIQRVKQTNKLKLEMELELIEQRRSIESHPKKQSSQQASKTKYSANQNNYLFK